MGLEDVIATVERVESLFAGGETGPIQDSLSWQKTDADVQLGKACAMLGTGEQLRHGTNHYVSIVELSFNAIERSFQFYLVDQTAAESSDFRTHGHVFEEIERRGVFSSTNVASRIDAFRSEHRARMYYDIDRPGRDVAIGMHELAVAVHSYIVEFADAQSRCMCEG